MAKEKGGAFGAHVCELVFGDWRSDGRARYKVMCVLSAFYEVWLRGDAYETAPRVELCRGFKWLWMDHWWTVRDFVALILDAENLRRAARDAALAPDLRLTRFQRTMLDYTDGQFDATVEFVLWFCVVYDTRCRRILCQRNNVLERMGVSVYLTPHAARDVSTIGHDVIVQYTKGGVATHVGTRRLLASVVFFGGTRCAPEAAALLGDTPRGGVLPVAERVPEGLRIRPPDDACPAEGGDGDHCISQTPDHT